jgi:hypothetical protein
MSAPPDGGHYFLTDLLYYFRRILFLSFFGMGTHFVSRYFVLFNP